jgi:hypothetical protein
MAEPAFTQKLGNVGLTADVQVGFKTVIGLVANGSDLSGSVYTLGEKVARTVPATGPNSIHAAVFVSGARLLVVDVAGTPTDPTKVNAVINAGSTTFTFNTDTQPEAGEAFLIDYVAEITS